MLITSVFNAAAFDDFCMFNCFFFSKPVVGGVSKVALCWFILRVDLRIFLYVVFTESPD